jgi:hypothetical protein
MKGHVSYERAPLCGYIYSSPHPCCNIILFIFLYIYYYIYLLSINGLLRIVLFILDIYIVNQLGSPQSIEVSHCEIVDFCFLYNVCLSLSVWALQ